MASHGTPSSGGGSSSCNGSSSGQHNSSSSGKRESSSAKQPKSLSVRIQPTIGPSFALSVPASTKIQTLKESISDKMGLSAQKMTLLLHNNALDSGTLTENGIVDGTEVRLVPAIESGVTTANSVDPVAMMKHSMSGISDQQIDDFLNGKFPLSVAIRVGESVVVVNLHRAKVEEIEMEPPPHKKRCVRARHPSNHDSDVEYMDTPSKHHHHHHHHAPTPASNCRYLNSNHSSSELMRAGNYSTPSAVSSPSSHRLSRRKSHRSLGKGGQDILSGSRHHHHHHHRSHGSSSSSSSSYQSDRSMLTYTRDTPMETSVAISAPPPMEGPSHTPIPSTTPIISKDAPVLTPIAQSPPCEKVMESKTIAYKEHDYTMGSCSVEESMEVSASEEPSKPSSSSTESNGGSSATNGASESLSSSPSSCDGGSSSSESQPSAAAPTTSSHPSPIGAHHHHHHHHHHRHSGCCSGHARPHKSVSRSVQTDPEPSPKEAPRKEGKEAAHSSSHRKDNGSSSSSSSNGNSSSNSKSVSRREVKLPDSGISMKRKAVMEAISEILKKMYANTEKGRLPGSFKGRFSSEFTCDSDMREILHSKTTMTSYGSEGDDHDKSGSGDARNSNGHGSGAANLSKAKLEEQQQLKDKVASLKWQMQHKRALKMAKRKGERSPCGWMERLNCDMPNSEPKTISRSGFCGMKRGFLLAD